MTNRIILIIAISFIFACNSSNKKSTKVPTKNNESQVNKDTGNTIQRPHLNLIELSKNYYETRGNYIIDPLFPGGDSSLQTFIMEHIKIPKEVKGKMFSTNVIVKINSNGKIVNIISYGKYINCKGCEKAIQELISKFPLFQPAIKVDNIKKTKVYIASIKEITFNFFTINELNKFYSFN